MIRSMTGFGQSGAAVNDYKIQIDIKSVNHRYQETMVRMPREWLRLEDFVKKKVQSKIKRGRVDVFITIEKDTTLIQQVEVNWSLAEGYIQAAKQINDRFGLEGIPTAKDLLLIPELVQFSEGGLETDEVEQQFVKCMDEAMNHLLHMRETEGHHLFTDMMKRLQNLEAYHQKVILAAPLANREYREKLRQRIQEMLSDSITFDENRFMMEVSIMAERANIDEEITRLSSHFEQYKQLMDSKESVGRKLDFLIQEMNREVNTIGSKSNHTDIINNVVEMKAELEKIREQVQNIE